jgi:phytoene synthase
MGARVLGVAATPFTEEIIAAAAQAYGRVRLLRSGLPRWRNDRARGLTISSPRLLISEAKGWLDRVRQHAAAAPDGLLPAILPVALVEPYLTALERLGPNIARAKAEISPLTRVWRLWQLSARGRV